MKKFIVLSLSLFLVLFAFASCAKKAEAPKAGSAKALDMLTLLPRDAKGILVFDVNRAMNTETAKKTIQESKDYQKYQEFIKKTGVDPQKDIFFVAAAMIGELSQNVQEGVFLVNMKYNKDSLLAALKEPQSEVKETDYNGIKIFNFVQVTNKKPMNGAFLDNSNIALGTEKGIRCVIDVYQKKAENVLKNKELSDLIKNTNKTALFWCAAILPAAATEKLGQNPMLASLQAIKALVISFDYKDKNILAEIKGMSPDEAKNKEIAGMLNGFKSLGTAAAAKEPKFGELLSKIEIFSAADHVKISASIPEGLLKELSSKMKVQKAEEKN